MTVNKEARAGDVTHQALGLTLWYGLPVASLLLSPNWIEAGPARGMLWAAAFGVMGLRCLLNARDCGRVHCYSTGPWFLLGSAGSLLLGFGVFHIAGDAWSLLANLICWGALILFWGSERVLGRYLAGTPGETS